MPSDLVQTLRQATRSAHARLDRHAVLRPLAGGTLDVPQYVRALAGLYRPQSLLEAAVSRGLQQRGLAYPLRRRSPALARDLADLGVASPQAGPGPGSEPGAEPGAGPGLNAGTSAGLVGLLYVLEGSRLGARVILANLTEVFGSSVPTAFFRSAADGRPWRDFVAFAQEACPADDADAAVAAACEAFALYERWLDHAAAGEPPGLRPATTGSGPSPASPRPPSGGR